MDDSRKFSHTLHNDFHSARVMNMKRTNAKRIQVEAFMKF